MYVMEKISKISKTKKVENDLRPQENEQARIRKGNAAEFDRMLKEEQRKLTEIANKQKKENTLDAYKFETQRNIIIQKRIAQMYKEEQEQKQEKEQEQEEK